MLWGLNAQEYIKYIDVKQNTILKAKHPAASLYTKESWSCMHFDTVNILLENEKHYITW